MAKALELANLESEVTSSDEELEQISTLLAIPNIYSAVSSSDDEGSSGSRFSFYGGSPCPTPPPGAPPVNLEDFSRSYDANDVTVGQSDDHDHGYNETDSEEDEVKERRGKKVTFDEDDTWDPMGDEYRSVLNFGFATKYTPSAFVIGGLEAEGEYASISEVPCRFNDGTGKCWKGNNCVRFHPVDGSVASVSAAAGYTKLKMFYEKDLANQPIPVLGFNFIARVVHVESVEEFYVIPDRNFGCPCGCKSLVCSKSWRINEPSGLEGDNFRSFITTNLTEYMDAKKRKFQLASFTKGQVVVINDKVIVEGKQKSNWCRAVVLKTVEYEKENPYKLYEAEVQLLDYGRKMIVPFYDVASIPPIYVKIAPNAFKCKLSGLLSSKPGFLEFCSDSSQKFKSLALDKEVVIKFITHSKSTPGNSTSTDRGYSESQRLYSTQIMLNDDDIQILHEMTKDNPEFVEHPFKNFPNILKYISPETGSILQETELEKKARELMETGAVEVDDEENERESLNSLPTDS